MKRRLLRRERRPTLLSTALLSAALLIPSSALAVEEGERAPDFRLPDAFGREVDFHADRGTSKAALEMACRVLQIELRDSGVALACVKPGPVSTSIVDAALSADPADFPDREVFVHGIETGTLADPEQVAEFLGQLLENVGWDEFASRDWDYRTDR